MCLDVKWRSHKMASFYSVFGFLAVGSFVESDPGTFDMLSRLPVEMALNILRELPAKDLLNAVLVSKQWLRLCKSDGKLRQKVRRYLRQMRRVRLAFLRGQGPQERGRVRDSPIMRNLSNVRPTSTTENRVQPAMRNGNRQHIPYQRDMVEKPKKLRSVKIINFSAKKLRI